MTSEFTKPTKVKENPKPVEDPEFWKWRIKDALEKGKFFHQIILDDSYDLWVMLQAQTTQVLLQNIRSGNRVLDAGCGLGSLTACFQEGQAINPHWRVDYLGVDISPDLIRLASEKYPGFNFQVADLKKLPFQDRHFNWVVCRAVEGMIIENIGPDTWKVMLAELQRVAVKVLLLSYPETLSQEIYVEILQGG